MALKNKRPSAGAGRGGKSATLSFPDKMHEAGVDLAAKMPEQHRTGAAETIEARLERKAVVADTRTFATESLGSMSREKRHKLLYGD